MKNDSLSISFKSVNVHHMDSYFFTLQIMRNLFSTFILSQK